MAVTLGKATDRDIPGVVSYQVSEWELDRKRSVANPSVDELPDSIDLDSGDLNELCEAFTVLTR